MDHNRQMPIGYQDEISSCCPNCNTQNELDIIKDPGTGEIVCSKCGIVIQDEMLSLDPEWRAFTQQEREEMTRIGAPQTLTVHDKGLSTTIGWQNRDAQGRKLKPEKQTELYRLRKWQRRTSVNSSEDRNLANALSLLEMAGDTNKLNLTQNAKEQSAYYYRHILKKNLIRGRTMSSVMAAATYIACRNLGTTKTLEEVSKAYGITKKETARNVRFILKETKIETEKDSALKHLPKYISTLKLSGATEKYIQDILKVCEEIKLTNGRGPDGMASGATYIGCEIMGEKRTQGEIAKINNVTEVTIRNRYKDMMNRLIFEQYV